MSVRRRVTNVLCAPLFDSAYLDQLESQWKQGYFLKNNIACRSSKDNLKQYVTTEWRTAKQISDAAGITYKSASKILFAMSLIGYVLRKEENWVDGRYRKRKRYVYKLDTTADAVSILDKIFGVSINPDKLNLTGHVTRHTME